MRRVCVFMCAGQVVSHAERDPDARCHPLSPTTHTHTHTSGTHVSLYLHPSQMHWWFLHPSPASPHVLPSLPQMGWVESWLRTFMPKTTCHPSLLLSRMVMLWEVRSKDYGRCREIFFASQFWVLPHFAACLCQILSVEGVRCKIMI